MMHLSLSSTGTMKSGSLPIKRDEKIATRSVLRGWEQRVEMTEVQCSTCWITEKCGSQQITLAQRRMDSTWRTWTLREMWPFCIVVPTFVFIVCHRSTHRDKPSKLWCKKWSRFHQQTLSKVLKCGNGRDAMKAHKDYRGTRHNLWRTAFSGYTEGKVEHFFTQAAFTHCLCWLQILTVKILGRR